MPTSRSLLRLALLLLPLFSTACSLPFTSKSHTPTAYAPDDGRPVIVCLGDSLTAGDAAPSGQSYPAWLQRRLDARGLRYRVVNAGVSGDRVADGARRLDSDVLHFHPRLAIVELGSNDPGHTSSAIWQTQLDSVVNQLQAHHVSVLLGGLDEPGMADVYRAVAARHAAPLVWFTQKLWSRPGLWGNAHHPNGQGYRVVMESFWPSVAALLHVRP
jgi:acyl-CoA thioesterase-1